METKPGDLDGLAETSSKAIQKEAEAETKPVSKDPAPTAQTSTQQDVASTEEVPDPDEDDLDDLDDMLDEFTPSKPEPPPSSSKPTKAPTTTTNPIADGISDEDFAKQLQAGMAELMGELDTSPDMQSQLEQMLKELGGVAGLDAAAAASASAGPSTTKEAASASSSSKETPSKAKAGPSEESFQETIKKTMERMQNSGDQATAAAASDSTDDILAQMMKAMESGGLDGEGGEEEFSKMLLGMMEQLTNKEILYEPMKELDDKFPAWMKENEGKVDAADMKRYKEQQVYVSEIVKRFETKTYTDDNSKDREYIVERMQKMQSAGSPPPDLVGDMAAAQEAFGAPEEGCPTQ
ncbi:Pex19 protein family-domain-containing protein [Rhexocercosporidium sp. MPI-PUGE-AT-0058]|nr:Pex19 protein family-domain-containing protein [Rhexocercosporidium sp. MPI-PUGE-AT-0058]